VSQNLFVTAVATGTTMFQMKEMIQSMIVGLKILVMISLAVIDSLG